MKVLNAPIHIQFENLPDEARRSGCMLRLRASAFDGRQRVVLLVDGNQAGEVVVDGAIREYDIQIHLPMPTDADGNEILLQLPDAHSPASIGSSPDARKLGVAVMSMTFMSSA